MQASQKSLETYRTLIPCNYWQGKGTLEVPYPWITPGAIAFLDDFLQRPELTALEFGAGGSTLWLLQKCASVVSIEPSEDDWADAVLQAIQKKGLDFYSRVDLLVAKNACIYRRMVKERTEGKQYDIVFVDTATFAPKQEISESAVWCVRAGGCLVIDNYGEQTVHHTLPAEEWKKHFFDDPKWNGQGTFVGVRL